MCTTCGCGVGGSGDAKQRSPEGDASALEEGQGAAPRSAEGTADDRPASVGQRPPEGGVSFHHHGDGRWHSHRPGQLSGHDDEHSPGHRHSGAPGLDVAHESSSTAGHGHHAGHPPAITPTRMVQIERDILARNDSFAARNRRRCEEQGIFALNLVSSPGSGKTSLLCRTIELLKAKLPIAVIEGDQQTSRDALRIRETGVPALQINTGKGCHLDAQMIGGALHELSPADDSLLLIENVGNLVCPAAFDLGEAHKVVILSVTEGEDKPLKYPNMFHAASLMLLNKVDLLPYVEFDADLAIMYAQQVNPALEVIRVSATTGEGFAEWLAWLQAGCSRAQEHKRVTVAALRRRIAELEARLSTIHGD
ncbi:hydrogenase nickel incorporation protein HypB [Accumulibacter sp.]|uniref:hydrogenase nickel incorporation protein HypB n=1 Tax=Accumulibacter sp. TaxID=2053492 RepID=UPI0025EA4746|nr:hydrogenase nickel incorporation protein HypB [Accumulibacter sp.]MCM8595534.1 hydrogenase nickel incorporation protein HypB [Accumulibacter sp.]MCM8627294.1 hydrogenase nickel incorporation protein HypB [Accumulibacter sp.]MDS4049681.1 hydrogenase nickel incorporation protein HypB [Accumulibacter sp.]